MKYLISRVIALALSLFLAAPGLVQAATPPIVRAVLFFSPTCPHCHYVMEEVLPPLQAQYGDQLQILEINATEAAGAQLYSAAIQTLAIPEDRLGVPTLIVGDTVLVGSLEIPEQLPGLIERHLAAGGVNWPATPGLETVVPTPVSSSAPGSEPAVAQSVSNGFALAITIMAGMVGALFYAGAAVVRSLRGARLRSRPHWVEPAIPLLALIGVSVAGYLAYVETQAVSAVCGPVGDCNVVQSSPYARLFGVLPIGVLGVMGYGTILAAWAWGRLRLGRADDSTPLVLFSLTIFGVVLSLYLTYLEPFVIGAVCSWCLTSAVIMTLLMLLSLRRARHALAVALRPWLAR
jgi:uncharacterized membrane protein